MKTIRDSTLTALLLISLAGLTAKADLFSADNSLFGAGSLTIDTRTGLAWLDLPLSVDLSYSEAEAATRPGELFAGFRHATLEEVLSLFNSAGFSEGVFLQSSPGFQKIDSLISLIGATDSAGGTVGITGPSARVPYITFSGYSGGVPAYRVDASSLTYGLDTHFPSVGNWLVLVPEPSSHLLMIAGGVIALLIRRRKV